VGKLPLRRRWHWTKQPTSRTRQSERGFIEVAIVKIADFSII
jgi:hypothetical protein